jgi:YebC/PmpR family DNA-binding regulatory protein
VKRGSGDQDGEDYMEIRYEGYGPGGVAVMVECLTDNKNRTVSEVRHAFTKHGGNLGTDGSVAYQFKKMGIITFAPGLNEDDVMEIALDAGADDVMTEEDGSIEVQTDATEFLNVKDAMVKAGLEPAFSEVTQRAETLTPLDQDGSEKMLRLQDVLEDLDDVQDVYTNAEIAEEALSG